jgi:hypothetical protein
MDQPTPRVGDTFCGLCDGCRFWPVALTAYFRVGAPDQLDWLCRLCAHTPSWTRATVPHSLALRAILRTICYVGNAILADLSTSK